MVNDYILCNGYYTGGAITILKNMKVNGKDYPIYYRKQKMFETTNQECILM
jgi:hypothetical protein